VTLHWRSTIVQCVRVLRRFALQLTLITERTSAAVTKEAVVANKLDIVTRVARLDAIDTNGIAVGGVACATSIEVVHRKTCIARDLVETLASIHSLFDGVVVVEHFVLLQNRLHSTGQTKAAETVIEDLIRLERGSRIVCYLNTRGVSIKNAIASQLRMALGADEHPSLGISENVVLFQHTLAAIKYAYSAIPAVINLITSKGWITVRFDPNTSHGIVEYFVLLQQTKATIIDQYAAIVSGPDFISPNDRVAASSNLYA